jgi:predicted ATPase
MLTSLRIQNFRSIRDASVKLGQVNLFIGPNNSGKSNFLKGIELAAALFTNLPTSGRAGRDNLPKHMQNTAAEREVSIIFTVTSDSLELPVTVSLTDDITSFQLQPSGEQNYISNEVRRILRDNVIYTISPDRIRASAALKSVKSIAADTSELVLFLFDLAQNNKTNFKRIQEDFAHCVIDLVSVSTPADPNEPGKLKLKFFDQNDIGYWAEEVSEGVLYFLALLCIVHQPDPPKLLLLEEPEKGIHPRRIKEVMDFIFELVQLRNVQIILTSHSPYVVDHFANIPECISVFDRENGETIIRNAGDIITETNTKLEAEGKKPIRYTDALGEHWVSGFLGGVPV